MLPVIPHLFVDSVVIPLSGHTSFLGVIVDTHLKFHEHINSVCKKISYGIRALVKSRMCFSIDTLKALYYAFIHSHLSYCITSWGNSYSVHIWPLKVLQKQAIRLITFASRQTPSHPIFSQLHILPVSELYVYNVCVLFFKVFHRTLTIDIFPAVLLCNPNRTRFSNNLLLPKVRTNYGKMSIVFSSISSWNSLSRDLKASMPIHVFKGKLKKCLFNV